MLLEIFQEHNNKVEKLIGKDFAAGTAERYRTARKHVKEYIKKEYSQYDWDAQSTIGKPEMLSKLYTISDGLYKNEAEVVFEPFEARIKNIEKITSVGGKRLSTPVYKIEV